MNKSAVSQQAKISSFFPPSKGMLQRKCVCGNQTLGGGECPECNKKKNSLQRKLTIGASNDPLEQEADRIADQVLSMPTNSHVASTPPRIQRFSGQSSDSLDVAPPSVDRVLASPGRPMETVLRQDMEARFGHDFSQVRVHTGSAAEQSARDLNALAYTVGRDVVFGAGRYATRTEVGKRLLAHELTHTIQQGMVSSSYRSAGLMSPNSLQRKAEDAKPTEELTDTATSLEVLLPEPVDEENFVVGNTMDLVSGDSPAELALASSKNLPKAPDEKGKAKMGGPLGPVKEGMSQPKAELSSECKEWIKLKRTTYPHDPAKGADPLEKEFLEKYKDFKEGIPIAEPSNFNAKLKKATATPCTCIENLNIDGHGGSWSGGAQEFAPRKFKTLGERSFGVKKNTDGTIVPYNFGIFDGIKFCKPCQIKLGGCYVALNTPKAEAGPTGLKGAGDALGKALAAKTGCSVTAYTDLTTTPKAGEFKGGGKGKWITTNPKKTSA